MLYTNNVGSDQTVAERALARMLMVSVDEESGFGELQFAYTKERGARDVLAFLVLFRIEATNIGTKWESTAQTLQGPSTE